MYCRVLMAGSLEAGTGQPGTVSTSANRPKYAIIFIKCRPGSIMAQRPPAVMRTFLLIGFASPLFAAFAPQSFTSAQRRSRRAASSGLPVSQSVKACFPPLRESLQVPPSRFSCWQCRNGRATSMCSTWAAVALSESDNLRRAAVYSSTVSAIRERTVADAC